MLLEFEILCIATITERLSKDFIYLWKNGTKKSLENSNSLQY